MCGNILIVVTMHKFDTPTHPTTVGVCVGVSKLCIVTTMSNLTHTCTHTHTFCVK